METKIDAYIIARIADIKVDIKLMETGFLKTSEHCGRGLIVDITADALVSYRAELVELELLSLDIAALKAA